MGDNNYSTNWIWCLSDDLLETAQMLRQKYSNSSVTSLTDFNVGVPLNRNSRIFVVGHGNSASTIINPKERPFEPLVFATLLSRILNQRLNCSKVKRISFHMCYGAKGVNGTIYSSFVHQFASVCDFAEEITGRTNVVSMHAFDSEERPNVFDVFERKVKNSSGVKVHRLNGGKILYKPRGGNLQTPKQPESIVYNYDF